MPRFWAIVMVLGLATLGCSEHELADEIDGFDDQAGPELGDEDQDPGDGEQPGEPAPDPGQEPPQEPSGEAPSQQDPDPEGPDPEGPGPEAGCGGFALIWPTTGTATAQTVVHDAYGPRLLQSGYDWHRGIDLPGDPEDGGFYDPVYAVADGRIFAIGNRPNPAHGAISGYGTTAGNVLVLVHEPADLHPGMPTLYSVYMHLDEIDVEQFPAIVGDGESPAPVDLREYYYLDGPDTKAHNRGRPRPTFKSSGAPIPDYPRVRQQDTIGVIGDSGAVYEHLHFEIRESQPTQAYARNPYAYLPHLDATMQNATLEVDGDILRATLEIPRPPGAIGDTTDLSQQLDVETVALQIVDAELAPVDELRVSLFEISQFDDAEQPLLELEGVEVELRPADFDSASSSWELELEFTGLDAAGLVPLLADELFALEVVDVCGNRITATLD